MTLTHEDAAQLNIASDEGYDPVRAEGGTGQSCLSDIVGGMTVLLIVFVVLKLTGYIAWVWWWVLAPIWMPLAFLALFVATWMSMWKIFKL